jgi:hypothetical protein
MEHLSPAITRVKVTYVLRSQFVSQARDAFCYVDKASGRKTRCLFMQDEKKGPMLNPKLNQIADKACYMRACRKIAGKLCFAPSGTPIRRVASAECTAV